MVPLRRCFSVVFSIFFTALFLPVIAHGAGLGFLGPVDHQGSGLGHVATVLTIQKHGVESGCVSWNGGGDITGPGAPACPAGIAGGDEKTGASQTLTRKLAELGNPTAETLRIVFNPNEPGSNRHLRLEALVLRVLAPSGAVLLEAALAAPMDIEATDSGIGSAGWAFGLVDAAAAAGAFANGENRVGLAATVSDADGGFETFYLATVEGGRRRSTGGRRRLGELRRSRHRRHRRSRVPAGAVQRAGPQRGPRRRRGRRRAIPATRWSHRPLRHVERRHLRQRRDGDLQARHSRRGRERLRRGGRPRHGRDRREPGPASSR